MRTRAVYALSGLLLALGCSGGDAAIGPPATPVVVVPVELRQIRDRIEATGELLARDQAQVAAEVPGRITGLLQDEGQRVEAGTVVLEIDPERRQLELADAKARVAEAEANLIEREREVKRFRQLRRKQVTSEAELDQAHTRLALAKSRLAGTRAKLGVAERALRDANVAAPFTGMISVRHVSVGEFVQSGQKLFGLVALDPIEVEFRVTERDSSRVDLGDEVSVRVAPYPDEEFRATVALVSPIMDPRTRTLRLKADLANPDGRLRPGLFARVDLGVDERSGVLMIPEEAILYRAAGAVAFRLADGNLVERCVVETGVHLEGMVEIMSGLEARDSVVRRGHAELIDGARVTARNPDGTPVRPHVAEGTAPTEGGE
jgi:membrane fusion protein (multidrug efflux system)